MVVNESCSCVFVSRDLYGISAAFFEITYVLPPVRTWYALKMLNNSKFHQL